MNSVNTNIPHSIRPIWLIIGTATLTVLVTIGVLMAMGGYTPRDRQADVAARGTEVMPFDLNATTHIFQPVGDGGVQQVVAKNAGDAQQIRLIREHLRDEAAKFRRGDFSDPAAIHGDTMPGLAEVRAGAARISVRYADLPNGAELRYTTSDGVLVHALHTWFNAQVSDHRQHATQH